MKVIFLDVDGVLNSVLDNNAASVDEKRVALLEELVRKTGAAVVLSSGWRFWFDDDMRPATEEARHFDAMLRAHGVVLYGKTPDLGTEEIKRSREFSAVKAKEIKAWLGARDDIESYVVLDDLDLKDEEVNLRRISVDGSAGLAENDISLAAKMLIDIKIKAAQ